MKCKKIKLLRPEIEVEYCKPFLGRLYLALIYHRFMKVGKIKYIIETPSRLIENAGHTCIQRIWYICIPKISAISGGDVIEE